MQQQSEHLATKRRGIHSQTAALVVLVHGIVSHRAWMWVMKKRLQRLGYQTHNYGYRSVRGTLTDHAQQLQTRLALSDEAIPPTLVYEVVHIRGLS